MTQTLEYKYQNLRDILKQMGSVAVAYSGGVDSSLLAQAAYDVLGERTLAVTAVSETYSQRERLQCNKLAKHIGIRWIILVTEELSCEEFAQNPKNRCYYCKRELYSKLTKLARDEGLTWVADGSNADDDGDYRPGRISAKEHGVRSPLWEAALTKSDIRTLSRRLGLPSWNNPASPCLASRLPYGERITQQKLRMVEQAEEWLREEGFIICRLRHHDLLARIEVPPEELPRLLEDGRRERLVEKLKGLGYIYITIDLAGYRSGSLNETLALTTGADQQK